MTPTTPIHVALIGAGNISREYLRTLTSDPRVDVVAVTDVMEEAAAARAEEFSVPVSGVPDLAYESPDIDLIVNLTVPSAHAEVSERALRAGKHVWSEKPVAMDRASGDRLRVAAQETGKRLGCAPDTFLGPGLQGALSLVQNGQIGQPQFARAVMRYSGPEKWHPNPAFLYAPGAGPLFDMGPYYLAFLVRALGPAAAVTAMGSTPREVRTIATGPLAGTEFSVQVPSTVSLLLGFESGASANLILSFDAPFSEPIQCEIVGDAGSVQVPDPNEFAGTSTLRTGADGQTSVIPSPPATHTRGSGVLDMVDAIAAERPHQASLELALHVLDIMISATESLDRGETVTLRPSR